MVYNLKIDDFPCEELVYVYSPICKSYPVFENEGNCLVNRYDEAIGDYEYISVVSRETLSGEVVVHARCDFDKYGAPIVVISGDLRDTGCHDGKNRLFYGTHFEVCAWERGCNVWHILPDPENTVRPIKPTKLHHESFEIGGGDPIDITVRIIAKELHIEVNGHAFTVRHEDVPERMHVGYTACEGINRLYSLSISN